jgi:hypothetical protein
MPRPDSESDSICGNCLYWHRRYQEDGQGIETGECRFSSPAYVAKEGFKEEHLSAFPETRAIDWCGDYQRGAR